jgi:hypothetical protein
MSSSAHRQSVFGLISVVGNARRVFKIKSCRVRTSQSCSGSIEQRGWEGYRRMLAKDGGVAIQDEAAALEPLPPVSVLATVMRQDSQKKKKQRILK